MDHDKWIKLYGGTDWLCDAAETDNRFKIKCECGVAITLGKDDNPMLHSEWCDVRKYYERMKDSETKR